ncbi:MAG: hypothetical protein KGM43_07970 [Planctomycetota bacterium]|nr:hypothetical protein [Planctomycetota bacterium]
MSSDLDQFDDENPYAAPRAAIGRHVDLDNDVWRDGDILVMTPHAELPPRCVKCNAPACRERWEKQFTWRPALATVAGIVGFGLMATFFFVPAGRKQAALPNTLLAEILRTAPLTTGSLLLLLSGLGGRSVKVSVGLCAPHERKQRYLMLRRLAVGAAGIVLMIVGPRVFPLRPGSSVLFAIGVALLIASMLHSTFLARVVWPQRITKEYICLLGVSPDYLDELPAFPEV